MLHPCALPLCTGVHRPLCSTPVHWGGTPKSDHQSAVSTLCDASRKAVQRILRNGREIWQNSTASVTMCDFFNAFIYYGGWSCGNTSHITHSESREQLAGVCPPFHHVGPGTQTQVVWLSDECLYAPSHLAGPWNCLSSMCVLGEHLHTSMAANMQASSEGY